MTDLRSADDWVAPTNRRVSPDRVGLPITILGLVTLGSALSMGLAATAVPSATRAPGFLFLMGAGSATLGVLALRSLSIQRVARSQVVVSALLATRLGVMTGGVASGRAVLWVMVSLSTLALASYVEHRQRPVLRDQRGRARHGFLASASAVVALATGAAILGGPTIAQSVESGSTLGDFPGAPAQPLTRTDRIDMGNRPDLSDEVLFSVRADRAAFWRTATLDDWDGRGWSRSEDSLFRLEGGTRIVPAPDDLAAIGGVMVEQEFRIESRGAVALPAAASAISVTSPQSVGQYPDGTLAAEFPLGRGASYTVQSRLPNPTERQLRDAGRQQASEEFRDRYATPRRSSERTKRLAADLAEGTTGSFERVQAIESWLSANTEYDLDAPLTPPDRDVVDHFLFESRVGWCEQVASATVVLLREMGVPARVAAGFTPGERDPITGRFVVREKNAHSWTEVWFAGIGWVPFDPTAGVPLASGADSSQGSSNWIDALAVGLMMLGLILAGIDPMVQALRFLRARLRRQRVRRQADRARRGRPSDLERVLEAAGRRVGLERGPGETASRFGQRLEAAGLSPAARAGSLADALRYRVAPVGHGDSPIGADATDSGSLDEEIERLIEQMRPTSPSG